MIFTLFVGKGKKDDFHCSTKDYGKMCKCEKLENGTKMRLDNRMYNL